jgi:hypothetical protein
MEHWPLARRPCGSERVLLKIPSATGKKRYSELLSRRSGKTIIFDIKMDVLRLKQ